MLSMVNVTGICPGGPVYIQDVYNPAVGNLGKAPPHICMFAMLKYHNVMVVFFCLSCTSLYTGKFFKKNSMLLSIGVYIVTCNDYSII